MVAIALRSLILWRIAVVETWKNLDVKSQIATVDVILKPWYYFSFHLSMSHMKLIGFTFFIYWVWKRKSCRWVNDLSASWIIIVPLHVFTCWSPFYVWRFFSSICKIRLLWFFIHFLSFQLTFSNILYRFQVDEIHNINIVEWNKKRKLQCYPLDLPRPKNRCRVGSSSSEHDSTFDEKQAAFLDNRSESESAKDSNSFIEDSDTSMSVNEEAKLEEDSANTYLYGIPLLLLIEMTIMLLNVSSSL